LTEWVEAAHIISSNITRTRASDIGKQQLLPNTAEVWPVLKAILDH